MSTAADTTPHKPKRKRFVWVSAISLGTLFSAATFGLGAGSLDHLAISLGLRTVVDTEAVSYMRFGDVDVIAFHNHAENMPAGGVAYRAIQKVKAGGEIRHVEEDGFMRPSHGMAISTGSYTQAFQREQWLAEADETRFCSVTANYRFGVPIYRFHAGIQHRILSIGPPTPETLNKPVFHLGRAVALENGWDGSGEVLVLTPGHTQWLDQGLTMNWNYCDAFDFGHFQRP